MDNKKRQQIIVTISVLIALALILIIPFQSGNLIRIRSEPATTRTNSVTCAPEYRCSNDATCLLSFSSRHKCIDGCCKEVFQTAPAQIMRPCTKASQPQCWLVLYNSNDPKSVEWANWYKSERNIQSQNMISLDASLDEHLPDLESVQEQIVSPVRNYLNENPSIKSNTMGIILGYGLPGHYGTPQQFPTIGGFSVSDALADLSDDDLAPGIGSDRQSNPNLDNTQYNGPNVNLLPSQRLTRDTMQEGKYLTARIDAPSLEEAKALTERAKTIQSVSLANQFIYYDYSDAQHGTWTALKWAVGDYPNYGVPLPDEPFQSFDSDTETPSDVAIQISWHDADGWNDGRLDSTGTKILAYNLNSFGSTTVRSTSNDGARFVPNAIESDYAAAIGATGEPQLTGPSPAVLIAALKEGWTLGEAFYLAKFQDDWMWNLIGDPFLEVPDWFS